MNISLGNNALPATGVVAPDIADLLNAEAERINSPEFIADDPVQFPRRFSRLEDIEIVSLISAIIAWGNRKMICRDVEKVLGLMYHNPLAYVIDRGYEDLNPDMNIHRTFFARHLQHLLRGLRRVYRQYGSLDAFCSQTRCPADEAPAWKLVENLRMLMREENGGAECPQCLPVNLHTTALKRVNMALRWLVRNDGIVDMGMWRSLSPASLYIPLDVHVGNTARNLGLLSRKANDRKSVESLTRLMRTLRPDDPAYYDFALFGIGIESRKADVPGVAS
ncbi:MAG: TIGR02757 family protein [Candidatus Amulumruptor caecigallinarius]|nr:TIGR02757 family protein [Candidatus Amulumruptor caecigallinarius]